MNSSFNKTICHDHWSVKYCCFLKCNKNTTLIKNWFNDSEIFLWIFYITLHAELKAEEYVLKSITFYMQRARDFFQKKGDSSNLASYMLGLTSHFACFVRFWQVPFGLVRLVHSTVIILYSLKLCTRSQNRKKSWKQK